MTAPLVVNISRSGLRSQANLDQVRTRLHGNPLALKYGGGFLNCGNSLLTSAERLCKTPHDQARREVAYGNYVFLFSRMTATNS